MNTKNYNPKDLCKCGKPKGKFNNLCWDCYLNKVGAKTKAIVEDLRTFKYRAKDIAVKYGITHQRVNQIFKKHIGGKYPCGGKGFIRGQK